MIWYQLNSQLVWDFWKTPKGIVISILMGIPISAMFWLATKWGYQGFGTLWPVRFMGFATWMVCDRYTTMGLDESNRLATAMAHI